MNFEWNFRLYLCAVIFLSLFEKCEQRAVLRNGRNVFIVDDAKNGNFDSSDASWPISDKNDLYSKFGATPLGPPKSFPMNRSIRSLRGGSRDLPGPPPSRGSRYYFNSQASGNGGNAGLLHMGNMDRICQVCRHRRRARCISQYCTQSAYRNLSL